MIALDKKYPETETNRKPVLIILDVPVMQDDLGPIELSGQSLSAGRTLAHSYQHFQPSFSALLIGACHNSVSMHACLLDDLLDKLVIYYGLEEEIVFFFLSWESEIVSEIWCLEALCSFAWLQVFLSHSSPRFPPVSCFCGFFSSIFFVSLAQFVRFALSQSHCVLVTVTIWLSLSLSYDSRPHVEGFPNF